MRPKGPLPPGVYWTRRVLLVAVVVVVGALVWWVAPGVGGSGNASANPGASNQPAGHRPETTPSTTTSTTSTGTGRHDPTAKQHPGTGQRSHPTSDTPGTPTPPRGHQRPKHRVLPEPSGPCDPMKVTLAVVVKSAAIGKGTTVGLRMSTGDGTTCSLGITPSLLETRITSGAVVVWQSKSCPDALPAKNVVVRPKPGVVYSYAWDGQINPDSCSATDRVAQPGGYWAEAALIGGEPNKSYFEVTPKS